MKKQTYSLHKINNKETITFSPEEYSKFKFGDKDIARKFGYQLAEGFISDFLKNNPINNQIVVISSPYCFIPTATFAMKDYFVKQLNEYLAENGFDVVEETKIHRTITYKEDYGKLSAEKRKSLIGKDSFHIDKEFVKGKTLLFLDDIKITGSHEWVIDKMIDGYNLDNDHVFLYFAELINKEVDPTIENWLNFYYVKSLLDLDRILKNNNFLLNTRMVKYILNGNHEEFKTFIEYQPRRVVDSIYHLALGNSYHKMDSYKKNFDLVREIVKSREY